MRCSRPLLLAAAVAAIVLLPSCQRPADEAPPAAAEPIATDSFEDGSVDDADGERSLTQRMEDVRQIEGEQAQIDAANELLAEQQAHADGEPVEEGDGYGGDGYGEESP